MYYYKVIVPGWEAFLLGGTVHVITALYGLMCSTVKPRFTIHWHMKYGDKVHTSYLENCISSVGSRRQDPSRALTVAVTTMYLLLMARCFHVCCRG